MLCVPNSRSSMCFLMVYRPTASAHRQQEMAVSVYHKVALVRVAIIAICDLKQT